MKIRHPLPQFGNDKVLLIVSGHQSADFYVCSDGEIRSKEALCVKKPVYPDREGFFMKSGYGKVFGAVSVLKNLKNFIQNRFVKKLVERTDAVMAEEKVEGIILFSPEQMTGLILEKMTAHLSRRVRMCIYGNYTKNHPLELLAKIQEVFDESVGVVPAKKEARKILEKSDQARTSPDR
jgi:hypothetical protein